MTTPRLPTHRAPTHPGEMLLEEFLNPMGITQQQLADAIHVPYQRVNETIKTIKTLPLRTLRCLVPSGGTPILQITEWVRFVNFVSAPQIVKLLHCLVEIGRLYQKPEDGGLCGDFDRVGLG